MNVAAEANLLLACLRAAAGADAAPEALDFAAIDADRFLDVVDDQRLAPWLARRADRLPGLPAPIRAELNALYYREARDAAARQLEIRAVRTALTGGPRCILLKGGALLAGFYEELAERPMWDIDLLADDEPAAREMAARLARVGFRAVRAEQAHHHLPALRRAGGDLAVEIHLDLHTPTAGAAFLASVREGARPAPDGWAPFSMPARPALVAHQCLHAFSDVVDSPLIRNVFEIAQLVRRLDRAGADQLVDLAGRTGLRDTIARALALAARWFGAPALLGSPEPGWPERLATWRIGQLGHEDRAERLKRHLAREAGEKLKQGWSPASALLPVTLAAEAAGRMVAARLGMVPPDARRAAPEWESVDIDGQALVADPNSGAVHLLQPVAAAVWRAPEGWSKPENREIVAALRAAGLIPA